MFESSMSASSENTVAPRRSPYSSLAGLLALIAIAIVVGLVYLFMSGQSVSLSAALASVAWVFDVVLVILAIVIIIWVVRLVASGFGGVPHSERYARRREHHRYSERSAPSDPAVEIARERFARGEISQEQLDQTLRQLGKST
jgi:uncharacterized membrane protein